MTGTTALFTNPSGLQAAETFEAVAPDLIFAVPAPGTDECETLVAHGKSNGFKVTLLTTGILPGGLTTNVPYFFVSASGLIFKLSLTFGGAPIDILDAGIGTHSIHADETLYWTSPAGLTF